MNMIADDQYMDDLFGDSAQVPLPQQPEIKGLQEYLDQLSIAKSCQKIAWSRFGCIASIAPSESQVNVQTLIRLHKDAPWTISKATALEVPVDHWHRIVHLQWSYMGNDLAVVDSFGRIFIYATGFSLCQMALVREPPADQYNDMTRVIGIYWLPIFPHHKKSGEYWYARNNGQDWTFKLGQHPTFGPANPLDNKSAMLSVSRNGGLRLIHQAANGRWGETIAFLEGGPLWVDESLTHASFSPSHSANLEERALLLATFSISRSVHIYRVMINWDKKQVEGKPPTTNPVIMIRTLHVEENVTPFTASPGRETTQGIEPDQLGNGLPSDSMVKLTHFEIITPPPPERPEEINQIPQILMAVFTTSPSLHQQVRDMMGGAGGAGFPTNTSSIVSRWQIRPKKIQLLLSVWDDLPIAKKKVDSVPPKHVVTLERLPDIHLHSAILSYSTHRSNTLLSLVMSDGSIEFRQRDSMQLVSPDDNHDEVQSLPQAGFAFPRLDPPRLQVALSPNACVAAVLLDNGEDEGRVGLHRIAYAAADLNILKPDEPRFSAAAAASALAYSTAGAQYKSTDDLLAILPQNINDDFVHEFVENAFVAVELLNGTFDFVEHATKPDKDKKMDVALIWKLQNFYKTLSMQAALGACRVGNNNNALVRNVPAKLAWVMLNLRLVSQTMGVNFQQNLSQQQQQQGGNGSNNSQQPPLIRAEIALSLLGLVKWSLDLIVYILQDLFDLAHDLKQPAAEGSNAAKTPPTSPSPPPSLESINSEISRSNSPALLLLLCSSSRLLLKLTIASLKTACNHTFQGCQSAPVDQRPVYQKLLNVLRASPVPTPSPLEPLLSDLDTRIQRAYTASGITSPASRARIERSMALRGRVPRELAGVAAWVLTRGISEVLEPAVDPGRVYLHEVVWLRLTDDRRSLDLEARHVVDVLRKMPLASGVRVRRCPRCASVMEDIAPGAAGGAQLQQWVWAVHKTCVCYNSWAYAEVR